MADEKDKVEEAVETAPDQVELVGEAKKAEAEAIEALPKVEKAEAPKPEKVADKPSKKPADYTPRLKKDYDERIVAAMTERFGYKNRMEVPRLDKIVINMGVGAAVGQPSLLEGAVKDLTRIAGQKPVITKARQSIANFKLREGNAIGTKVTLRGARMWGFLDRLISLAIPRVRDFRGLNPRAFDGRGNYTFGVNDQLIFPEVDYDSIDAPRGMDITIVTTATDDEQGRGLLKQLGFPFRDSGN